MNKKRTSWKFLIGLTLVGSLAAGCLTKAPQVTQNPTTGQPVTNYVYQASPQIDTIHSNLAQWYPLIQSAVAATPAAPAAPFAPNIIDGIFGLVALGTGALAAYKNKQAATAQAAADQHQAAAAALAAGVNQVMQSQPGLTTALQSTINAAAKEGNAVGTVAEHLANANSLT